MPKPPEQTTLSDGTVVIISRPDALPADALRNKLREAGSVRWDECHERREVSESGYRHRYTLVCPLCEGTIVRISDRTPGDKESWFEPCDQCGLTGDGSTLQLVTSRER